MAMISNSKIQKGDLKGFENEKTDFFMRSRFKTHYLFMGSSQKLREFKDKNTGHMQHQFTKGKLKFQCHFEERKRRAEFRRKKIIQKLKKVYRINVDGLNEHVTDEIIKKVDIFEKESREREKRNVEKTLIMINRLLQEQNHRRRVMAFHTPTWPRRTKDVPSSQKKKEMICKDKIEGEEKTLNENFEENEISTNIGVEETQKPESTKSEKRLSPGQEENILKDISCVTPQVEEKQKSDFESGSQKAKPEPFKTVRICAKPPKAVPVETCLKSTPDRVVFEDYERNRVYLQKLIITNIGLETIHCRYLGIAVKDRSEKRFPIGVAVRDNIKLRPGLSCSTKIRLCCHDADKEFECAIVYETRRQTKPLQHSCFFVPVLCQPARALIKVTPLKIIFPALTWCSAVGPNGQKLLKKTMKIENTGGKGCSCKISDQSNESHQDEDLEEINEEEEEDEDEQGERKSSKTSLRKPQVETTEKSASQNEEEIKSDELGFVVKSDEFAGEDSFRQFEESFCTAETLMEELLGNVFANFRFSEKYFIEVPPHSIREIEIRFIPEYQGFHHEIKYLQVEDCHNCVQESIELVGDIKKLPLRSEPQVIDLKTCVVNSGVYSKIFRVYNDSKGPYPVKLKIPSCMRRHGHVQPRATIIQNSSFCDFSFRFYPRITLATDAPQYFNQESGILEFPLLIQSKAVGGCSSDYIVIHVFALITDYALELSPPEINFGTVTTLETVRTTLQLTNHSLTIQEYGFLNLPKGVRVEPNMGFGRILPKESIPLYLLYSPVEDIIETKTRQETHVFRVMVTSLTELGGFREKLRFEEETLKPFESILGEYDYFEFGKSEEKSQEGEANKAGSAGKGEVSEPCDEEDEEDSSIEGEEHLMKITDEKMKIRNFLKEDFDKTSEHSFFKRIRDVQESNLENKEDSVTQKLHEGVIEPIEECDEEEGEVCVHPITLRPDYNVIKCEALVIDPFCQISESVIQLPATPCSSFSLYRFRLNAGKGTIDDPCSCGFKGSKKKTRPKDKPKLEAVFEFQNPSPQIKLEPQSGSLKAGESLPITIIYRPEFPAHQIHHEARAQKAKKFVEERKLEKENSSSKPNSVAKSIQRGKRNSSSKLKGMADGNEGEEMTKMVELDKYDLFAGEKSLQQLVEPFCVETRIQCVIKVQERTEIHDMILICPAVKPNFLYLGHSQEINFGKVFCGTKPKFLLEIQNISVERISPGISLLNPVGSFSCPAALRKVEVDPEHVWRQPLTYSPSIPKGVEREYFEIHSGSTNLFLTVIGEAIEPQFKITPNFGCCLIETKLGNVEEIKLEIENLNPKPFQIQLVTDFLKEGRDIQKEEESEEVIEEPKKENPSQKGDSKDKKKVKNASSDRIIWKTWDEIPDFILSELGNFKLVKEGSESKVFTLIGGGEGGDGTNEITVQANAKFPLRIRFSPQANIQETDFEKVYAVKYKFLLERISPLKEVVVVGKISKAK